MLAKKTAPNNKPIAKIIELYKSLKIVRQQSIVDRSNSAENYPVPAYDDPLY
jgi:hypothetical protein